MGYLETFAIQSSSSIEQVTFSALTKKEIQEQVNLILQYDFNLLVTVGAACTQEAKNIISAKQSTLYTLFCDVHHEAALELIESENSSNLTGVSSLERNYKQQIEILKIIKPHCKKTLIAYDPTRAWLTDAMGRISTFLQGKNIEVLPFTVENPNSIVNKLSYQVTKHQIDVIITLRDRIVTSKIDDLINLCEQNNDTLYSSDLVSVKHGATIGFGESDYNYGIITAHLTRLILEEKLHPSQIPITKLDEPEKLLINNRLIKKQGLVLNHNLLKNIEYGIIY